MKSNTESKDISLISVIDAIFKGDYQLPEFQRDYVWKDSNIKSLFESVLSGHPIGTILILELDKEHPLLAWTNFQEILPPDNRQLNYSSSDKNPPEFLVLDGQQRLTSLCHITHGTRNSNWYLDLNKILDSWEWHGCPEEKNSINEWIEQHLDIAACIKKGKKNDDPMGYFRGKIKWMPLIILKDKNTFQKSLNEVRDAINKEITEKSYEKKNLKRLKITQSLEEIEDIIQVETKWSKFLGIALPALVDNYFDYKLPTVVVSKGMGITGVCKVFTKINTTGIELGAFDLTVAVLYPQKVALKQMFDDAMDNYPLVKTLDADAKRYVLHTLALLSDKSPKTASLPEVLRPNHFEQFWDRSIQSIEQACRDVDKHCGAAISTGSCNYLVYSPLISILAYVIDKVPIEPGHERLLAMLRIKKLRAWYFGSGISNRYSEGTDAKQQKDKSEMLSWFESSSFEERMPTWLSEGVYGVLDANKSSATGKAIISLFNILNQKDFYRDTLVGPEKDVDCDLHHIFPKAAMREKIMNERNMKDKGAADKILRNEYQIDSILNQTWLLAETNRTVIQDKMPSVYFYDIIKQYGGGESGKRKLLTLLSNHLINEKALNCLLNDDYFGFIDQRRNQIAEEFKTNCGVKMISRSESSDADLLNEPNLTGVMYD